MLLHRAAGIIVLALGVAGAAGCAAGAYGVWLVWSRLGRANEKVFDAIDRGLGAVEGRLPAVRGRVRDAKVTTAEVTDAVQAWAAKKVRDRVATELEVENRVEKVSGYLQAADARLEASTEAVLNVRGVIELGQTVGARVDPSWTDDVLEQLAVLRVEVREAERAVDEVRRFATPAPGESVADRLARVAKVLTRILLTVSDIDRRLDHLAARLPEVRAGGQQRKDRTGRYILWGSVACYGLLAWVAAGQVTLARCGRAWYRRGRNAGPAVPGPNP